MPSWKPKFGAILAFLLFAPFFSFAQGSLTIYGGAFGSGWNNGSYGSSINTAATSPVHGESHSVQVTITGAWGAFGVNHADMADAAYGYLSFWINGGPQGGQNLQVYGNLDGVPQNQRYYLNVPAANAWQQVIIPLSAIGVDNASDFSGFAIQDAVGSIEPTFYVDDIELVSISAPAVVHLTVDASQLVRAVDPRWFGVNAAMWDDEFDTAGSLSTLQQMGIRAMRFPGGSDSDDYHWLHNHTDSNTWTWSTSLANYIDIVTNLKSQTVTTLNYGTGTTNEAAAWVAYVNAQTNNATPLGTDALGNWRTAGYWASLRAAKPLKVDDGENFLRIGRTAPIGFQYWEVGNEEYGSWETDSNTLPHDPFTYAMRAADYITQIKSVDPTAKIGVVVTPGEDAFVNYTNRSALNPRTGISHNGWTPVLLATMKDRGVFPDFLIHHVYPQPPGGESDAGLLLASAGWASQAANLRQMIADYAGSAGTNIELVCTENNSVSSNPGKQSVSLVNGLFKIDSLAALAQTEFNGLFWWNLRNGDVSLGGNTNAALYGWREYGDYGVLEGADLFPTFYTTELTRDFMQEGDSVLTSASDYMLLSAYATRRQDGSLTMLVVNKSPTNTQAGQISLAGFAPAPSAIVYSYGIPQDNANIPVNGSLQGSPAISQTNLDGVSANFSYAFPPYSATVIAFSPTRANFASATLAARGDEIFFQFQGQAGAPYVVQSSTNLIDWISVATNVPASNSVTITNSLPAGSSEQYWRLVWRP